MRAKEIYMEVAEIEVVEIEVHTLGYGQTMCCIKA
jgi:hypothetical protein